MVHPGWIGCPGDAPFCAQVNVATTGRPLESGIKEAAE